ncbi:MAG: cold shock domain-containing protein [Candidatus Marinimicrobia bacterium]|nr:cold shock domain-containing protein [Candidatus Neomarinimicrobiota bacterium]
MMLTGTIKKWEQGKGWGFIEGDDGEDYFLNIANVRKGQHIRIGLRVKFDFAQTQQGIEAENVTEY